LKTVSKFSKNIWFLRKIYDIFKMENMKAFKKAQVVAEYILTFAVIIAVLIVSMFIFDIKKIFKDFRDKAVKEILK